MISLKVSRLRKHSLMLGILVVLTCVLASTRANAQGDDLIVASRDGDLTRVNELLSVKAQITQGTNVNAKGTKGITALIAAAYNGHFDVVQVLLAKGAEVDDSADNGWTPLIAASAGGAPRCGAGAARQEAQGQCQSE